MHPGVFLITGLLGVLLVLALAQRGGSLPSPGRTVAWGVGLLLALLVIGVAARQPLALPGLAALILLGSLLRRGRWGSPTGPQAPPQGTSEVSTDYLHMTVDLGTGQMSGEVLQGRFAGSALDSLGRVELGDLLSECDRLDPQGARVLRSYLDQRYPGWREGESAGDQEPPESPGTMTRGEAAAILGLEESASQAQVVEAHRRLMQRVHPDRGGSDYLAAQINRAKEVLLGE